MKIKLDENVDLRLVTRLQLAGHDVATDYAGIVMVCFSAVASDGEGAGVAGGEVVMPRWGSFANGSQDV